MILPSHVNVSQQKQFHSQVCVLHQKITLYMELSQLEEVGRTNQAMVNNMSMVLIRRVQLL